MNYFDTPVSSQSKNMCRKVSWRLEFALGVNECVIAVCVPCDTADCCGMYTHPPTNPEQDYAVVNRKWIAD